MSPCGLLLAECRCPHPAPRTVEQIGQLHEQAVARARQSGWAAQPRLWVVTDVLGLYVPTEAVRAA